MIKIIKKSENEFELVVKELINHEINGQKGIEYNFKMTALELDSLIRQCLAAISPKITIENPKKRLGL